MSENIIEVLNSGYVRLTRITGTELDIVNAARVSFEKESLEFSAADAKLLKFLIKERHTSPFRHVHLSFEVKAPLMVARQWWRHIVGSSMVEEGSPFSEASRRYVTSEPEFYIPDEWRGAASNKKQGSGGNMDENISTYFTKTLIEYVDRGIELYEAAMEAGMCAEQARLFLPAYGMYVLFRWTPTLNAVMNFLDLRLDAHAQKEILEYAKAIQSFAAEAFPNTFENYEAN